MPLHVSSTCAYHQEVKIALHSLWYHHTYQHMQRPDVLLQLDYIWRHVSAVKRPSSGQQVVVLKNKRPKLMSLAILFHLCAQHVSDINISIIRSLRLFYWITTLVVLFLVRCVEFRCGWVGVVSVLHLCFSLQHGYHSSPTTPKLQHTSNQEQYDQCGNSTE